MDCVGCSKCRLWGKLQVSLSQLAQLASLTALLILKTNKKNVSVLLRRAQTQGLGTALKVLFSEREIQNLPEHSPSKGFQLTRQEIVALLNAFGRYARRHNLGLFACQSSC